MFSLPAQTGGTQGQRAGLQDGGRCDGRAGCLQPSKQQGPLLHLTQQVVWFVPPSFLSCINPSPLVLWGDFMLLPVLNQGEEVNGGTSWCCWPAACETQGRLSSPRQVQVTKAFASEHM